MKFSPDNDVVRLCIQGMRLQDTAQPREARAAFQQAWSTATDDHEKFLAAFYVSGQQDSVTDQLAWLESALSLAMRIDDAAVWAALPLLHARIAECHERLDNPRAAERNREQAAAFGTEPRDRGPFFHGTRANLNVGDLLSPGNRSNYEPGLVMNHIYFTALADGAGLAAALSNGEGPERVYEVEPIGTFENDPNVTNQKFPGNPTRSYRSTAPLRIVGVVTTWERPAPEVVRAWRERIAKGDGKIIN